MILVQENFENLVKRFYEPREDSINYNDLILECKNIVSLNPTLVETIKHLHEVVLEDIFLDIKYSNDNYFENYFERFIDHAVIKLIETLNPKVKTFFQKDIFAYENEIILKKMVYFTKHYLKNENKILLEQDEKFLSRIASRRKSITTDDSNNISNDTFLILKSLTLCCLDQELDSIFYLSKLFLKDKIKFASCYDFAKEIFDLNKDKIEDDSSEDECRISFYLLFSEYNSCIEIFKNSKDKQLQQMHEPFIKFLESQQKVLEPFNFGITSSRSMHKVSPDDQEDEKNDDDDDSSEINSGNKLNDQTPDNNGNQEERNSEIKDSKEDKKSSEKYFILSIDGGGIKGLIPLYFLRELEIRLNRKVYDLFDMFAGTSIGGIIALILSQKKYSAESLLKKMLGSYKNEIFNKFHFDFKKKNFFDFFKKKNFKISYFNGYLYNENNLEKLLQEELKDLTLKDSKGGYFITSNILTKKLTLQPCVFIHDDEKISNTSTNEVNCGLIKLIAGNRSNNYQLKFELEQGFDEIELYKIGRATSAASPYFKYIKIKETDFIDGGYTNNNPSKLVYQYVVNKNKIKPENIYLLSLGCSKDTSEYSIKGFLRKLNFGLLIPWKEYINLAGSSVDNDINTNNTNVNEFMGIIKANYFRFSPAGGDEKSIKLDGISNREIWILQESARKMIKDLEKQINKFCKSREFDKVSERYEFIGHFEPRYDLYPNYYANLNVIVDEIKKLSTGKQRDAKIEELKAEIKTFKFEDYKLYKEKTKLNEKIHTPFTSKNDFCYLCKSLAIGYLPAIEILNSKDYFNENYLKERIIHICDENWTQYHVVAANCEFASFLYLLKDRLYKLDFSDSHDRIISYEEKDKIKHCIESKKKFLEEMLEKRETSDKKTAIKLSEIDYNDKFSIFFKTIVVDLDKL